MEEVLILARDIIRNFQSFLLWSRARLCVVSYADDEVTTYLGGV